MNDTTAEPGRNSSMIGPTHVHHQQSLYPYEARVVLACFWMLFTVMGLVGGNLVILAVVLSKKLRTVTNVFVVNLSVADLWSTMSYPWMAVAALSPDGWPLEGDVPCVIAAMQFQLGLGSSLFILAAIALNRLVVITQPIATYRRLYTPRKVAAMVAATWVIPGVVLFLPPILGVGGLGYDHTTSSCTDIKVHAHSAAYSIIQSIGIYPIPMLLIICSYTALYIHIRRHFKMQRGRTGVHGRSATDIESRGEVSQASADIVTINDVAASIRRESKRQQEAITKNLFMVCCVFVVFVSPYYLMLAVPGSASFTAYLAVISTINSCVNPVIYTVNHPLFKEVIQKMLLCRFSEIPEPSPFLKSLLSWKMA